MRDLARMTRRANGNRAQQYGHASFPALPDRMDSSGLVRATWRAGRGALRPKAGAGRLRVEHVLFPDPGFSDPGRFRRSRSFGILL